MSLILSNGSKPANLIVSSFSLVGKTGNVYVGNGIRLTLEAFCRVVKYVFTNTPLQENDPRLKLLQDLQEMQIVQNPEGGKSLVLQAPKDVN